jgi:hypothetical protein
LHRERDQLFPDEAFSDLFEEKGRRSVPPSVVAVVMVLQRLEGLSDREAAERYCFDNRWRYAASVGGYDIAGWTGFAHTVLVDMRERLRHSEEPNRIFDVTRAAANEAGLIGRKRVLDSTPLYDAVATMDTVTIIRSAVRGLLKVADAETLPAFGTASLRSERTQRPSGTQRPSTSLPRRREPFRADAKQNGRDGRYASSSSNPREVCRIYDPWKSSWFHSGQDPPWDDDMNVSRDRSGVK